MERESQELGYTYCFIKLTFPDNWSDDRRTEFITHWNICVFVCSQLQPTKNHLSTTHEIVKPGIAHKYTQTHTVKLETARIASNYQSLIHTEKKSETNNNFKWICAIENQWRQLLDTNCHSTKQNGSFEMRTCISMIISKWFFLAVFAREICSAHVLW